MVNLQFSLCISPAGNSLRSLNIGENCQIMNRCSSKHCPRIMYSFTSPDQLFTLRIANGFCLFVCLKSWIYIWRPYPAKATRIHYSKPLWNYFLHFPFLHVIGTKAASAGWVVGKYSQLRPIMRYLDSFLSYHIEDFLQLYVSVSRWWNKQNCIYISRGGL